VENWNTVSSIQFMAYLSVPFVFPNCRAAV
jgi:hypothetical protein